MASKKSDLFWATLAIVLVLLAVGVAGYFLLNGSFFPSDQSQNTNPPQDNQNQQDPTANWNVLNNTEFGFQLKYPSNFFDVGHDPKILIGDCNYNAFANSCPNVEKIADQELNHLPVGNKVIVNNTTYCSYQVADAAAGHQYYSDYYATVKNQKCVVAELVTSTTTCENYLPLESGNTEQEQNYNTCIFKRENRSKILNQIINTFTFTK